MVALGCHTSLVDWSIAGRAWCQAAWPKDGEMGRQIAIALYGVAMVAVVVGADFAFFRDRFWERLMVNIGIVLVFGAFYLRFFRG